MNAPLTTGELERFRDFFYRKTGIYFESQKAYYVEKRLQDRMHALSSPTFADYFSILRFDPQGRELQALVNLMTINETYFYREDYQFQALLHSALAEIRRQNQGLIRIWTIPCSTGEEPYSIALHLLEDWPEIEEVEVEIVASDISTEVLESCAKGIYSRRSVQHLPEGVLARHFTPLSDGRFQISEALRSSVSFCRVNLVDRAETARFRDFDVVFCRNLLIYFDDASRREAAESIYDALRPGGFVFLGHSESMSRISPLFELRKLPDAMVWQKPSKP